MSALRPAFFILYLESYISRLNEILRHDLTLSVGEPDNAAAQTGAGTAFGVNGDHEQGLCLFTRFALQFSTCIAVRLLKFSVLHGKGESKYRPVATNSMLEKLLSTQSSLLGQALVGTKPLHLLSQTALPLESPTGAFMLRNRGPSPNPALASHRWCESGVSHYIAFSIPEWAFIIFTGGRIWLK